MRLRGVFVLALALQFWALYVPRTPSVDTGLPLDKLVHGGLFAAVTWLGLRLGYRWIVPAMLAQAGVSELVQHWFLPQRGGDIWDFVADAAGMALAVVITLTWPKTKPDSGIAVRWKGRR